MKKQTIVIALTVVAGAAVLLAAPTSAIGQERSGADMWAQNCGRCHRLLPPTKYTADKWEPIMAHMSLWARLTPDESEMIREFLQGAARRTAQEDGSEEPTELGTLASTHLSPGMLADSGDAIYQRQCVACHGKGGAGDGPAAVALSPKPADLTDLSQMGQLTESELLAIISDGRKTMPGFSAMLSPAQLTAVAEYVRSLSSPDGEEETEE
jgi:mono/diheme cytochrome c family protein